MGRYERKTEMPSIKLFKDDINALLLLPNDQFALAIKTIIEIHDTVSSRDSYKDYEGKPLSEDDFEKIDLPDIVKKRIKKIFSEMYEDIDRYWKRADINASNRGKGKYKIEL